MILRSLTNFQPDSLERSDNSLPIQHTMKPEVQDASPLTMRFPLRKVNLKRHYENVRSAIIKFSLLRRNSPIYRHVLQVFRS